MYKLFGRVNEYLPTSGLSGEWLACITECGRATLGPPFPQTPCGTSSIGKSNMNEITRRSWRRPD
jgi:hypothetical protein